MVKIVARAAALVLTPPLLLFTAAPAHASCAPSEAVTSPSTAQPGETVTVSSTTWFGICNDTGRDVDVTDRAVVTFVQGSQRVELGRTNSNAEGVFSLKVRVPESASTGPAVLEVRGRAASDDVDLSVASTTLPLTGMDGATQAGLLALMAGGTAALLRRRTSHNR